MNLQTSKLSKVRSKSKVSSPSTNIRWSHVMMTLELLQQDLENGVTQLAMTETPLCKNQPFLCVHTLRLLSRFLSRVYNLFLKIKTSEMDSKPYKFPLENQNREEQELEKSR